MKSLMHDAIAVPCSILYIELRINFRTRDLTAMRKQQTQAGEAKKKKTTPVRYNRLGLRTFLRHDNTTKMEICSDGSYKKSKEGL